MYLILLRDFQQDNALLIGKSYVTRLKKAEL